MLTLKFYQINFISDTKDAEIRGPIATIKQQLSHNFF